MSKEDVLKKLHELDANKSTVRDGVNARVLKEVSKVSLMLH